MLFYNKIPSLMRQAEPLAVPLPAKIVYSRLAQNFAKLLLHKLKICEEKEVAIFVGLTCLLSVVVI